MLKISRKMSVTLSIAITYICIAVLIFVTATAWNYIEVFFPGSKVAPHTAVILFTYAETFFAFIAAFLLLFLLKSIKKDIVFVQKNVSYIRSISWLCFIEALLFAAEGSVYYGLIEKAVGRELFFAVFLVIAFACAFLGIIVRVVKNIIEQATELKNENDYTI